MSIRRPLLAALACVLVVPAATATATVARGRLTTPIQGSLSTPAHLGAGGPISAVATPDGGAELFVAGTLGYTLVRVTRQGTLDPTFGVGGIAPVAWPAGIAPGPMLREPDGHLVVLGGTPSGVGLPTVDAVGLNPDGTLNQAYGTQGVTRLDLQVGRVGPSLAGVQADGAVVFTASSGPPPNALHQSWVVARLTTAGVLDPTFGTGGIAAVTGENSSDDALVLGADDSILTLGAQTSGQSTAVLLDRLTPDGTQDPSWNGGAPLAVPFTTRGLPYLAERPDGSSVVAGVQQLFNVSQGGSITGGPVATNDADIYAPTLTMASDGAVLFSTDYGQTVQRFNLDGTMSPVAVIPQFAGNIDGNAIAPAGHPVPLAQVTRAPALLPLAGGGYLGYTTVGLSSGQTLSWQLGLEWLTPALALDTTVGAPPTPLQVGIAVRSRLRTFARSSRHIRVTVTVSAPCVARVIVRAGRAVIAQHVAAYLGGPRHQMVVPLTRSASQFLATHRNVAITATLDAQDVIGTIGSAGARGSLH